MYTLSLAARQPRQRRGGQGCRLFSRQEPNRSADLALFALRYPHGGGGGGGGGRVDAPRRSRRSRGTRADPGRFCGDLAPSASAGAAVRRCVLEPKRPVERRGPCPTGAVAAAAPLAVPPLPCPSRTKADDTVLSRSRTTRPDSRGGPGGVRGPRSGSARKMSRGVTRMRTPIMISPP